MKPDGLKTGFSSLAEGRDYYIENGFCVFTAGYLLRRGYCCGSGCRHCPYTPKHGGKCSIKLNPEGNNSES